MGYWFTTLSCFRVRLPFRVFDLLRRYPCRIEIDSRTAGRDDAVNGVIPISLRIGADVKLLAIWLRAFFVRGINLATAVIKLEIRVALAPHKKDGAGEERYYSHGWGVLGASTGILISLTPFDAR